MILIFDNMNRDEKEYFIISLSHLEETMILNEYVSNNSASKYMKHKQN